MITPAKYRQLKRQTRLSPSERDQIEVFEFLKGAPDSYTVYVRRHVIGPGLVDRQVELTARNGQLLGRGKLGRHYWTGNSRRYSLKMVALNGVEYRGIYFVSAGDYARIHKVSI